MFSRYFINRPIFAFVISIFIIIAGLAAIKGLPIAQYPEIAPPTVSVVATYPGASAEVAAQTVATPLENAINGVEDMLYMSSSSTSNGVTTITVTFEIGSDVNQAALNVNNRVKQVEVRLPEEVRRQSVVVSKGSSAFLQVLAFYSPDQTFDDLFTSNYATLNVLDQLKRIPGTTNVNIFGAKDYAMRIWVKPDKMTQLGLTISDISAALNEQNSQFAAGKIGQTPINSGQEMVYTITTKGRLSTVAEFENIILRANADGSLLRLKEVARVELGSKNYDFIGRINGNPATLVGIFLQPGANALSVAEEVQNTVKELSAQFPRGLTYSTPYDTTRFVEVSIREVLKTLAEAMILVFLVVFLFLQNWRATLIPTLAVPVSLLGTFAGLHILGYSINTLTLFGMVLSIGIVVDDAIVVLENVERIMHEEALNARDAAFKAMQEVSGPIVAIVLVLVSVFVPIAFLGGLTGELYRQFAITISAVNEATLPELNDEFYTKFGITEGGNEAFRDEVKKNMQIELDKAVAAKLKNQVMDSILDVNEIIVPKSLVEEEAKNMAEQMQSQYQVKAQGDAQLETSLFEEQAKKRVALGMLLAELVKVNEIKAPQEVLLEKIKGMAATYENPQEVMDYYMSHKEKLAEMESFILEEKIVDWACEQATVTEKEFSFTEFMNPKNNEEA